MDSGSESHALSIKHKKGGGKFLTQNSLLKFVKNEKNEYVEIVFFFNDPLTGGLMFLFNNVEECLEIIFVYSNLHFYYHLKALGRFKAWLTKMSHMRSGVESKACVPELIR